MKKQILRIILISLCGLNVEGQEYEPILKEGSYWQQKYTEYSHTGSCSSYSITKTSGDTIVNNISYKKLERANLFDENGSRNCIDGSLFVDSRDFIPITNYFLREDADNKRLYILENTISGNFEEYLLCDFNLNIGDELENFYGQSNTDPLTIISIEIDANDRKKYTVSDGSSYVEGLGKTSGNDIPYNLTVDFVDYEISCFGNDESPVSCSTEYMQVLKEGMFWDVITTGPGVCAYMNKYRVGNNFIHNEMVYKKIETAPIRDITYPDDLCLTGGDLFVNEYEFQESETMFLRENSSEQKIYILVKDDSNNFSEYTIADFTLEVGQELMNTFTYDGTSPVSGMDLTITHIDIQADGRKRFTVANNESYEEAIGSNQGPLQIYRPFTLNEDQNSVSCYGNNNFTSGDCVEVLSTNSFELPEIKIYPNPTTGIIKLSQVNNYDYKVYSILGKEMKYHFAEENQEIDVSKLKSGIYFLKILGNNNSQRVIKIIKN